MQILERESVKKMDFAKDTQKNSQLEAASYEVCGCKLRHQVYLTAFNTTSGLQSIRMIAESFLPKSLTE